MKSVQHVVYMVWLLTATTACSTTTKSSERALAPGQIARDTPTAIRWAHVASKGVLTYAAAFLPGSHRFVSIELKTQFELVVRSIVDGALPRTREHARVVLGEAGFDISSLSVTADHIAYIGSTDATTRGIDLRTGQVVSTWRAGAGVTATAAGPNYVAIGTTDGVVCVRRRADGALLQCVVAHAGIINDLELSTEQQLASAGADGSVTLWQVPSLRVMRSRRLAGSVDAIRFARNGEHLAVATSRGGIWPTRADHRRTGSGAVRLLDGALTQVGQVCYPHTRSVSSIDWAPTSDRLLTTSADRTVRLIHADNCQVLAVLDGFENVVRSVHISHSGRYAVVGSWPKDLSSPSTIVLELLYRPSPQKSHKSRSRRAHR